MRADRIQDARGVEIDPFGAAPHQASRAAGLRGGDAPPEADYLFRTLPVAVPPGPASFVLRFAACTGGDASIFLDLTSCAIDRTEVPVRDRTMIVPVGNVVRDGGALSFAFEAHPGLLYALAGYLQGQGVFAATTLTVELLVGAHAVQANGVEQVELPRLTSLDRPSFDDPVSQPRTRRQWRNARCRDWIARLSRGDDSRDHAWGLAYIAQTLTRYGALRPGARGLCVGDREDALCDVFGATDAPDQADYAWSMQLGGGHAAVAEALRDMLHRLRPEGLGIIVFDYAPGGADGAALDRPAIERIALDLVAGGHEVGQLKFRTGEPALVGEAIAFGLIVRRAAGNSR